MYKLLSVSEVAELLNVKESTIYDWTHSGFIPHYKLGRRVLFKLADIEKWLKSKYFDGRKERVPQFEIDNSGSGNNIRYEE